MPRWVGRIGLLAGVYAIVMTSAALWMPHEWDWHVLNWLSSRVAPAFSPDVIIVDVDWNSDIASDRRRISDFVDGLVRSDRRPSAVILDVEFLPCQSNPCAGPMAFADRVLVSSIRHAARRFPIYATEEPQLARDDLIVGPLEPVDPQVYGVLSGAAQTRFTSIPNAHGLFYRICYADVPLPNEAGQVVGVENVWAMVPRVLMTARFFAASPPCDQSHIPVRLGLQSTSNGPVIYRFTDARTFKNYAALDNNTFVIVGTVKYDRLPFVDRSGPEVLGWALSNALEAGSLIGKTPYYDVQPQNARLLMLVPVFSALAVLAYVAFFLAIKRLRLRGLRHLSPWLSAAFAAIVGLAIVGAFELSQLLAHHLAPQVSLITIGVVLAAGLSGVRGSQILAEESENAEAAPPEVYDYDVFISYARRDRAWVFERVFVPFRDTVLPDGRRLSVFFDAASIRPGTQWQEKIALAIDKSRFVVPVYSDAYFEQPYCRFEILRAHRKWVEAGEESRCVLPIMLGHPTIMAAVDDIQALSVDDHPDLVAELIADVVARLSRRSDDAREPQGAGSA